MTIVEAYRVCSEREKNGDDFGMTPCPWEPMRFGHLSMMIVAMIKGYRLLEECESEADLDEAWKQAMQLALHNQMTADFRPIADEVVHEVTYWELRSKFIAAADSVN